MLLFLQMIVLHKYVFQIFCAIQNGMRVQICIHIPPDDLYMGRTHNDICVTQSMIRVNSIKSRCSYPIHEIEIRNIINCLAEEIDALNNAIESIRLT